MLRLLVILGLFVISSVSVYADQLSEMISPVTHFVNFEDPRIISELRPIYVYHEIDDEFVTEGGDVQAVALQARFALSESLAFIATKDGYIDFNPDATLPKDEGFADIGVGFKYAFYQDAEEGEILTAGLRYEIPMGDKEVLQGQGDGEINPFISGAIALGDVNLMAATGFRIRLDPDDSTFYDLDIHADVEIGNLYPFFELGVIHVVSAGSRLPISSEGHDLFNFGSSGSDGKTLVTGGIGARYRITDDIDYGVAYQFPFTSGLSSSIVDFRVTTDFIYRFDLGLT